MKIFMYRTSGGKDLLKKISREVKPVVLTILLGLQEDGVKNFIVKPIDKNISPTLYEIKKNGVRVFYYICLLYTSPSPRDRTRSRMPSSA